MERRAAYFHAIRAAVAADLRPGGNLSAASNASAEILANGARLAVLAEGDEALEQEIDPWMIETVTFMSRVYGGWTQVLRHGGPSPAWAPLERDVGRWLNERLPLLDAAQRAQMVVPVHVAGQLKTARPFERAAEDFAGIFHRWLVQRQNERRDAITRRARADL